MRAGRDERNAGERKGDKNGGDDERKEEGDDEWERKGEENGREEENVREREMEKR